MKGGPPEELLVLLMVPVNSHCMACGCLYKLDVYVQRRTDNNDNYSAALGQKVASEVISEHLICKIFLGEHTSRSPKRVRAYTRTQIICPPNLKCLPPLLLCMTLNTICAMVGLVWIALSSAKG